MKTIIPEGVRRSTPHAWWLDPYSIGPDDCGTCGRAEAAEVHTTGTQTDTD